MSKKKAIRKWWDRPREVSEEDIETLLGDFS